MHFNVLSAEISHETNTFNIHPTELHHFESRYLLNGSQAIASRGDKNTEVAGLMDVARAHDWAVTHVLSAAAGPGGRVSEAAFDALTDPVLAALESGSWDGIFLILHGAMVTAAHDDGEGEILRRIRTIVGPEIPIAATLDPHANVTQAMCDQAQILLSFTTYPHVDIRATARRAGELLQRTMTGDIAPRTLRADRPMLEEVNAGRTDLGAMIERHAHGRAYEARKGIYAVSINAGFACADIADVGPTILVTHGADPSPAQEIAEELAEDIWQRRHEALNTYLTPAAAAEAAARHPEGDGPLVIADFADNPGSGAYGDGTALLSALLLADVSGACFGPLVDPAAVSQLWKEPKGSTVSLEIGGKTNPDLGGGPIRVEGDVVWKGDGIVVGSGPILGGLERNFGATVVLRVGDIDILIVSIPHQILDLRQFQTFGIDPLDKRVVALKSMQHFRAAFAPIAGRIIVCDSGALCTVDYAKLPYSVVRRPIFPLDP